MKNQEGLEKVKSKISKSSIINARISIIAFVIIILSPFIWIWYDGWIAFKVFLSGAIILLVTSWVGNVLDILTKKIVKQFEEKNLNDKPKKDATL